MENPKIRFKGFTKDWEQRKLGDVFKEYSEKNHTELSALTIIQGGGTVKREDSDRNLMYDTSNLSNYKMVRKDDFIVHLRSFEGGLEKSSLDGIISPAYHTFHSDMADSRFYYPYFRSYEFIKHKLVSHVYGIRDGRSIDIDGMKTIEIPYTSIEEQRKIGDYLDCLDHLITLHQRKCEQTKKLKKYMLQKMFPQNGAKVPEIRFDGFTYDWEQRKLSDVLDIVTKRNGEKYGKEEVLSVSDEYGCINQIKFQGRSFAGEDISNYKIVDTGDIIYTRSPLKSKPYGIIKVVGDEIGIVSPLYIVNKVKEGNNSQFIYRVFDSPEKTNKYLSPLVRKGAKNTMNISNDEWLSGKIDVAPSYEEQYQIGLYFDHLDHLITLHQRKCDELKKMKKYMLQNMFI